MVAAIIMTIVIMKTATKVHLCFSCNDTFPYFLYFVPFFIRLRPLKKYREFVSQQQKFIKPEILPPITDSEFEQSGPVINTDVFNQIKAKEKSLLRKNKQELRLSLKMMNIR